MPSPPADEVFEAQRGRLQGLAYRMLGSMSDAEDVVQEAWVRWERADRSAVASPDAWLVRVCTRLAIDRLRSLRARRETYVGPWLPEPVDDGELRAELDESLTIALLTVFEQLSPGERAAFLLHDVFGHPFEEVAAAIDRSVVACRKLASRARVKVRGAPRPAVALDVGGERLVGRFLDALRSGDAERLGELLTEDVVLTADGGGIVEAAREPVRGREDLARFLSEVVAPGVHPPRSLEVASFNGAPGLVVRLGDRVETAYAFAFAEGRVAAVFAIRNPEKLARL
jgi:RNA polymerase sigma-70 factor (ECF subfamily)